MPRFLTTTRESNRICYRYVDEKNPFAAARLQVGATDLFAFAATGGGMETVEWSVHNVNEPRIVYLSNEAWRTGFALEQRLLSGIAHEIEFHHKIIVRDVTGWQFTPEFNEWADINLVGDIRLYAIYMSAHTTGYQILYFTHERDQFMFKVFWE